MSFNLVNFPFSPLWISARIKIDLVKAFNLKYVLDFEIELQK